MGDFAQIRALTLKSFTLQWRQRKTNLFQIAFPIIIILFIFLLQLFIDANIPDIGQETITRPIAVSLHPGLIGLWRNDTVSNRYLYVADPSIETSVGYKLQNGLGSGLLGNIQQFPVNGGFLPFFEKMQSEQDMDEFIYNNLGSANSINETLRAIGGYIFSEYDATTPQTAKLRYTVQAANTTSGQSHTVFCSVVDNFGSCRNIVSQTMISQINTQFIARVTNNQFIVTSQSKAFPYRTVNEGFSITDQLGVFFFPFILSLLLPVFMYTIVLEKQGKLRDMMKLMGMKMRNYWFVTLLFFAFIYLLSLATFSIMTLALQFRFMTQTNGLVLLLLLVGWGFNLISMAVFFSSFVGKVIVAVVVGYLLCIFGPMAGVLLELFFFQAGEMSQRALLVIPFLPFTHVFNEVFKQCNALQCPTAADVLENSELSVGFAFLFGQAFVMLILGFYLDAVLPQPWGIRKHPLFFIKWIWDYFMKGDKKIADIVDKEATNARIDDDVLAEKDRVVNGELSELKKQFPVLIRNLKKTYNAGSFFKSNRKLAVKGLHLAMAQNECFGLLGANGAGKTTTISMLCGLFPPSYGDAYVNGYSIIDEIDQVHLSMGLCPQFDIIWDDLTCEEHLLFYARLKGVSRAEEQENANSILTSVGLAKRKATSLAGTLSGGMKRRLSIGISLVGNPKIVLLDEPTTGLDPKSKRHLWDVIGRHKKDRCIILTTHSLEEADALCDRIGIMSRGNLKVVGSGLHLKNKFGKGFRLAISFKESDQRRATEYIHQLLPQAVPMTNFAGTIVYELPKDNIRVSQLYRQMEEEKAANGISEWVISQTSLEDVFLTIAASDEQANERAAAQMPDATSVGNLSQTTIDISSDSVSQLDAAASTANLNPTAVPSDQASKIAEYELVQLNPFMRNLKHFALLMKKNFILYARRWKSTVAQLVAPVIIVALLWALGIAIDSRPTGNSTYMFTNSSTIGQIPKCYPGAGLTGCHTLAFTTNGIPIAQQVIDNVMARHNLTTDDVISFSNHTLMENYFLDNPNMTSYGVAFMPLSIPVPSVTPVSFVVYYNRTSSLPNDMAAVQLAFDNAVAEIAVRQVHGVDLVSPIQVSQKGFPRPTVNIRGSVIIFANAGPPFFSMATMILFVITLYSIVLEKESRLRFAMQTMGMRDSPYWASWFFTSAIIGTLASIVTILTGMAFQIEFFINAEFLPLLLLFEIYSLSLICFAFFISTFVNRSRAALVLGFIILGLSYILNQTFASGFFTYIIYGDTLPGSVVYRVLFSLYPPFNFAKMFADISFKTQSVLDPITQKYVAGEGYVWADMYEDITVRIGRQVLTAPGGWESLLLLACNGILFFILALYCDNVISNGDGVKRSPWFFLSPVYWGCYTPKKQSLEQILANEKLEEQPPSVTIEMNDTTVAGSSSSDNRGQVPMGEDVKEETRMAHDLELPADKAALRIVNLVKQYGSALCWNKPVKAVRGLNLAVSKGTCLALLGHNGAGKTTTISTLVGSIPPTKGDALIYGNSVRYEMDTIRKMLGVCPQHDILWDDLTAREHLDIYARLKGVPSENIADEIRARLRDVALLDEIDKLAGSFSGGMKRRLSVAISCIGHPKLILLDEPTTGMDPKSRRQVWELIRKMKGDRLIILTTHSMEEADALSDRIAIMAFGSLRCIGDSLGLKQRFGAGYNLQLVAQPNHIETVKQAVAEHLSSATVVSENAGNMIFNVPSESGGMAPFLELIENFMQQGYMKDWGLSHTTLEEVYLKVTRESGFGYGENEKQPGADD